MPDKVKFGPIEERSCTDILCLLTFIIVVIVLFSIGLYGWKNGHPDRMMQAYDSDGRPCGHHEDTKDYKYIYLTFPYPGYYGYSTCVKHCPSSADTTLECVTNSKVKSCTGSSATDLS